MNSDKPNFIAHFIALPPPQNYTGRLAMEGVQVVCGPSRRNDIECCHRAAELATLRRVDAPKPDSSAVNFECVGVDDARLPAQIAGEAGRQSDERQRRRPEQDMARSPHDDPKAHAYLLFLAVSSGAANPLSEPLLLGHWPTGVRHRTRKNAGLHALGKRGVAGVGVHRPTPGDLFLAGLPAPGTRRGLPLGRSSRDRYRNQA